MIKEAMTLEEAVAFFETDIATAGLPEWERAVAGLLAHAKRTIKARSGEPEYLRELRKYAAETQSENALVAVAHIDTLTANRDSLAACVERVRELARFQNGFSGVVRATDILAALEGV